LQEQLNDATTALEELQKEYDKVTHKWEQLLIENEILNKNLETLNKNHETLTIENQDLSTRNKQLVQQVMRESGSARRRKK